MMTETSIDVLRALDDLHRKLFLARLVVEGTLTPRTAAELYIQAVAGAVEDGSKGGVEGRHHDGQ